MTHCIVPSIELELNSAGYISVQIAMDSVSSIEVELTADQARHLASALLVMVRDAEARSERPRERTRIE
jgi:hypothetical protein